uniref:Uncharacterized protein n=1 Tax=Trichobilharzia regenti TaxID=157069 RepID=A0AA85KAB3_TRIRE
MSNIVVLRAHTRRQPLSYHETVQKQRMNTILYKSLENFRKMYKPVQLNSETSKTYRPIIVDGFIIWNATLHDKLNEIVMCPETFQIWMNKKEVKNVK